MNNSDYWKKRFEILEQSAVSKGASYYSSLEKEYREASRRIESEISTWYTRFATNNGITLSEARKVLNSSELAEFRWTVQDYIKFGEENALNRQWMKQLENASARVHISRLEALKIQMQQQMEVLYGNQTDGIDILARKIYSDGYYHTAFEIQRGFNVGWDLQGLNEKQLERVLNKPWTADNQTFRDKCWKQKTDLVSTVSTELTQAIMRGDSPDKAIKTISEKFNAAKNKAGRLVMTESAYFASEAQKDCFNELDVERFEIVATLDSHTSKICQDLDGKVFEMKDYQAGVTAPPFHPWCRTTTVPYFEDNYTERAARDAEGNTYYVPSTMTYKNWKKTFVDGGSKGDLKKADVSDIIKIGDISALKEAIFNKNKSFLSDAQQTELQTILDGMDDGQLTLYDKLSENFARNDYHYKGGAAYYPWERKVKMNIDANSWDKAVGSGYTGAWNTKFHEEFHQLDHILALNKTKFARTASGSFADKFTHISTDYGKRMIQAIDDDILTAINKAVDWRNAERVADGTEATFKHLKNLDRISGDASDSLVYWLKQHYRTAKQKAQIDLFTDAVGLSTKNRIPLYSKGFWGHKPAYNKERGKSGATSETWATFASLFNCGDAETVKIIQELMPSTWETYSDIMKEVLEYAADNPLIYPK